MHVHSLSLKNYRNYSSLELELEPGINIFLGQNAQGKTNVMEAIYYASLGHSHRTRTDTELILWEQKEGYARIAYERMGILQVMELKFSREERRKIISNGQQIPPKEMIGKIHTVLFSPEDLFLIKGAPLGRRRFLDGEISQASPSYYQSLLQYHRILSQRNTLLKSIRERKSSESMLDLWDVQLAETAAKITRKRKDSIQKLNRIAEMVQGRISSQQEKLAVLYEMRGMDNGEMTNDLEAWYNNKLRAFREKDILRGSTGIGPHHDDLVLEINGINLRSFGSQGQQRTGALALKLSELEFLRSETGEYPILLLDDVMSELDAARRRQLLDFICKEKIQTLVTATEEAYFQKERVGAYYEVSQGRIRKL